jgi:DNA polymerase-3 subunit alpha
MRDYGLTEDEIEVLKPHFLKSHGVPPSQEQLMTMLMDSQICGFSLKDANAARKIVGKKQMSKIPELHKQVLDQAASPALGKYVWECGLGPQMGYSFSVIHALAYSFIGFQTAYIATKWNPIYWDTACLVVNSGSLENTGDKGTDYAKIAKAISTIKSKGIKVSLVNINTSNYGFEPDIENNRILYGLKAISNISEDTIEKIKSNRPYIGIKDFMTRCPLTKTAVINLIKAGAFDEVDTFFNNRKEVMAYYILKNCDAKKKLTLQNFNGLVQHDLIPQELEMQIRIFNFNKYLKAFRKHGQNYLFDDACMKFFEKFLNEYLDWLTIENGAAEIAQTKWDKIYKKYMDVAREWLKENQDEILKEYNKILFKEMWDKYASGNESHWEMDSLCFYYGKHELINVDNNKYGIVNFKDLSPIPDVEYYFKRGGRQIPIYKLRRIAGTVLAKDDNRCSVILLTTTGVVTVKFTRDYYAMFKKQISEIQSDGTKKVVEKSWFTRGKMLVITGFRREDTFVGKTYANTEGHQLYLIEEVVEDKIKLRHERYSKQGMIEENYE